MTNIVLFGMQGAGKGTQAKLLAEKYGLEIFETGAELRKLMQEDSDLARKVREIVERGDLVPNEIVMEIVENFLQRVPFDKNVLFDGLPRSLGQKETFDALLKSHGREFFGIFIDIPHDEAIRRLLQRGRSDDNEAAISRRIENYERETLPVIRTYEEGGRLFRVNGMGSIDQIHEEIERVYEAHRKEA